METKTNEWFNSATGVASPQDIQALGQKWKWILATGIVYVILGAVAFTMPVASTLGLTIALSALLLVGGIFHLIHAVELRHRKGAATRFVQSLLTVVTGGLMLVYPGAGMFGVALMLSFYFLIGAVAQWLLAMTMRPQEGWGWGIASSIMSFVLAIFILFNFPFSALWVPGTLLGIDLVFAGCSMVAFSMHARKAVRQQSTYDQSSTLRPSTV